MPKYCGVDGEVREIVSQYCGVDGEVREIKEEYCGVDGEVRKIFSKEIDPFDLMFACYYSTTSGFYKGNNYTGINRSNNTVTFVTSTGIKFGGIGLLTNGLKGKKIKFTCSGKVRVTPLTSITSIPTNSNFYSTTLSGTDYSRGTHTITINYECLYVIINMVSSTTTLTNISIV